jgi:hypothetical protein
MSTKKLSNISLKDFREFVLKTGCNLSKIEGGMKNGQENILHVQL